jgi:hypothetical protein
MIVCLAKIAQDPPMNPETPVPPPVAIKDRKAGLVVFGVLTVLMGTFCALIVPLTIFGQAMARKSGASPTYSILPVFAVYGSLAIVFIWLGVGSIMARRWARALLLVISWSWLLTGVISLVFLAFLAPQFLETIQSAQAPGQPALSPAAKTAVLLVPAAFLVVILFILPLVWALFYGSKHVKATCETRDNVIRWTDRCPLPVLAVTLWLGFGGLMLAMMPFAYRGVFPFFGQFVVGPMGMALYFGFALLWGYCAYALYKLDLRGWWLIVAGLCLFSLSSALTYANHDISELYRLMGYPEEQIAQIQKFNFLKGGMMIWSSVIYTIPFLLYLIYIRRFFVSNNQATALPDVKAG